MSYENIPKNVAETRVLTEGLPTDFFLEVGKGNIPGHSLEAIIAKKGSVGTSFECAWGAAGCMTYPVAAETWEIVSSDVADTANTGTGAWTVAVTSLDADFNEQVQVVSLNGTTPVSLTGTHIRPKGAITLTAGVDGDNTGDLTIQVSGGGAIRNVIASGEGTSQDGHYTVPAGKTLFILQTFTMFGKDDSGNTRTRFRVFGDDAAWANVVQIPLYQNLVTFNVKALLAFPEKSDIALQAKATTGTVEAVLILEVLIVDNAYL